MDADDYAAKRRKMDRWFEIHAHLECEDCNPRPVSKGKGPGGKKTKPDSAGKGSAGRGGKQLAAGEPEHEAPLGSRSEELGEQMADESPASNRKGYRASRSRRDDRD